MVITSLIYKNTKVKLPLYSGAALLHKKGYDPHVTVSFWSFCVPVLFTYL